MSLSSHLKNQQIQKDDPNKTRSNLLQEYENLKNLYQKDIKHWDSIPINQCERKKIIIELLHQYNDIKDACQMILGVAANLHQCTIKDMHLKYDLPLEE